ncbi:MAG: glycosyltransferase family 2 protein [Lachnospiraceae bacterium]
MNEKLSVIIPVYNVEKYLERCVQSIREQTYRNLEIILINDGSSDGSADVCDRLAEIDSRILVIHKKNGGVSSARNEGLKICTGDYVTFCDSDDELSNKIIYEECIKLMIGKSVDAVFFSARVNTGYTDQEIQLKDEVIFVDDKVKCETLKKIFPLAGYPWNKVWKRRKLVLNEGEILKFDITKSAYEDMIWILSNYDKINSFATTSLVGYTYYVHENSLSHEKQKRIEVALNGIDAYLDIAQYYKTTNQIEPLCATKEMIIYIIIMKIVVALKEKDEAMIWAMKNCFLDNVVNIVYSRSWKLWLWSFIIELLYRTKYRRKKG